MAVQHVITGGSTVVPSPTPTTVFTPPAGQVTYIKCLNLCMLAAIPAGDVVTIAIDGFTLIQLTPVQGAYNQAFTDPIPCATGLSVVGSAAGAGTIKWALEGENR